MTKRKEQLQKVCLIRHGYYPRDPRVRKEAEALIDKGFEVDVVCLKNVGEKPRDNVQGVNIYRLPLCRQRKGIVRYIFEYTISFVLFTVVVLLLYFKKKYVVIQVNTLPDFLVFVTLIPKLCGAKVVLDMHEAMPELFRSNFGFNEKHPLTKLTELLERLSTWYADYVLAVGESILQLYVDRGLSRSKAVVIPNTPDERLFDYQKYGKQQARGRKEEFIITAHGTILERYGYQVLIKAVPYLKEHIPNLKVIILGEGEFLEPLKKLAEELRVQNYVSFMGYVPLESVPSIISGADIGVVPIVRNEFTVIMAPNKLFEYVAMKIPVIAPKIKGIQDYFDDSCLMFFSPGDEQNLAECIIELYRKPKMAKAFAENAWMRFQHVKWSVTKERYYEVFARLLQDYA